MDSESSTKFIGSLTKFLQSLCNGYVEFDDGVELIGHIYLSVDAGKTGKTLNYFLNEKVCKNDNSVTFISNSFHAQPEAKLRAALSKESESKKDDGDLSDSGDSISRNTSSGTTSHQAAQSTRSAASPSQNRPGVQTGTKRPGSPLKGPTPAQRRAATPPSQRRIQTSNSKGPVGSPYSKAVPSSPSSSSQDNIPSPSPARKIRSDTNQPTSNQTDNAIVDNESDILPINPPPEFASFLGSLTSDNQTSQDQSSPPDIKPDTDVTFIKEEFVSEPSSCAQTGSSRMRSGRSGEDSSGLYPVMLHQNTSVFPSTSAGYPPGYPAGASTSQHSGFPGSSTSQSDPFSSVPGTSHDGADPSGNIEGSDSSGFHSSHLRNKTSAINVGVGPSVYGICRARIATSSQRVEGETKQPEINCKDCDVPCCTGDYTNCPCGCQAYSSETHMTLDPDELEHLRQKCTCSCCGLKFHNKSNLRRHEKSHLNIYRHHCHICGRMFSRSDTLKLHITRKHKNEHQV